MSAFSMKATSKGSGEFVEIPPAGNHLAVLVGLIDLGTQRERGYGTEEPDDIHKVFLVWELPREKKSNSTINHTIGSAYRLSFHEKASLRKLIEAWRGSTFKEGEGYDLPKLLGKKCLLSVTHHQSKSNPDRTYAKVAGVGALEKGMAASAPSSTFKPICWSIGDGPIPAADWIPYVIGESIGDVIPRSPEWKALHQPANGTSTPTKGAPVPAMAANEEEAF